MSNKKPFNNKTYDMYTYKYRISETPSSEYRASFAVSNANVRQSRNYSNSPANIIARNIRLNSLTSAIKNSTKINWLRFTRFFTQVISLRSLKSLWTYRFGFWLFCCFLFASIISVSSMYKSDYRFLFPNMNSIGSVFDVQALEKYVVLPNAFPIDGAVEDDSLFSQVKVETYTLQSGDFLINIANANNLNIDTLISWNDIKDARRIQAGDDIVIPNKDGVLHTVTRGETVASISNKYDISIVDILDANDMASNVLISGNRLFIPNAKMDEFELGLALGTIFQNPTYGGYISSRYGYRTSPITGKWHFHAGLDIANKPGAPIYATASGSVSYVSVNNPTYGKMVVIRHAGGFQSMYAHMNKIYVTNGQYLTRGSQIGTVGNTGLSTGPHLHFVIIENGKTVNPLRYIRL